MKILKLLLLGAALGGREVLCPGATAVGVPLTITGPFDSRPFLIPYPYTIRYQQVFSASAFRRVPTNDLYLSRLSLLTDDAGGINIGRLQVNLSTTERAVDDLSTNFAENIGPDDMIVFGPGECVIYGYNAPRFELIFQRPFAYRPSAGNLLIDVRVFEGNHWWTPQFPSLEGQNVSTDELSRVFADDVAATSATGVDSGGFSTALWFYPVPSLSMYTRFTGGIKYFFVEWPTCPTVFRLQRSSSLGPGADWVTIPEATNDPTYSFQLYWFPVGSAPPVGFYRLYWDGGP